MTGTQQRSHNRIAILLDAAAKHFAAKGYRETTIRDFAQEVDMLPGSIYYHFASKADVLLAVYDKGVERIEAQVAEAVSELADPWDRLQAAMTAHLETVLDQSDYARVIIRVLPDQVPEMSDQLTRLRDRYESLLRRFVDDLPLPTDTDRRLLRLLLLGAMNWSQNWYQPGPATPSAIAAEFVTLIRNPQSTGEPSASPSKTRRPA